MTKEEYQRRIDAVKVRAHGNWPEFLLHLGLEFRMIKKRMNLPCPFCGGTDRFQFTDKYGDGSYFCRNCKSGNGFQLAQQVTGMDFHSVLEAAEKYFGSTPLPAQAIGAPEGMAIQQRPGNTEIEGKVMLQGFPPSRPSRTAPALAATR